ncbi:response regulator [Escherichia coli]|nr:response regulator [Escherichia coli]
MQRILIIEDEQKTGRYLQQGLVEEGYQADLFNNGRDGLGAASKGQYDLIILDVMLPFLDGWQIISALRESGHEEPVLFLTAKDNVRDKVKGLELGADDYLIKPFDFTELVARVRTLLRRARSQAATVCTIADMTVDMVRRTVIRSGNLLSNAIKYSPDNTCTAIHLERDSDCVNVMITNTMSGQVPANLERLFDRFYRTDSSRFYNTEGAGLGLSITRSIIHAHGGELSAEQQGREIVFKVRLLMD